MRSVRMGIPIVTLMRPPSLKVNAGVKIDLEATIRVDVCVDDR